MAYGGISLKPYKIWSEFKRKIFKIKIDNKFD
jgi:hypothetical protein